MFFRNVERDYLVEFIKFKYKFKYILVRKVIKKGFIKCFFFCDLKKKKLYNYRNWIIIERLRFIFLVDLLEYLGFIFRG